MRNEWPRPVRTGPKKGKEEPNWRGKRAHAAADDDDDDGDGYGYG